MSGYYFECGTCCKVFKAGWQARENHLQATGHAEPSFECDSCPRFFGSENARYQHMLALNHFVWDDRFCDETWPTEDKQDYHEREDHHYCQECDRTFRDSNGLKMHLNSRIHRTEQVQCPLCQCRFGTATGVVHHIERGFCPNARDMTRETLYHFVRRKDPLGVFTKHFLEYPGSTSYGANDRAYNQGRGGWECYFCHRLFNALTSLNQHLNSPVHKEALYNCPKSTCRKEFTTLAGIINHFESESCGFTRFDNVQQGVRNIVSSDRMIAF